MNNIQQAKQIRVDISTLQKRAQMLFPVEEKPYTDNVLLIVDQKLQEARMWLGIYLREQGQQTPYTEGDNPNNSIVTPEQDT